MRLKIPLLQRDIGLGGLVRKSALAIGFKPCGECKKREAELDKRVTFVPSRKSTNGR